MSDISPDVRAVLEQMNASMPAPADFDVAAFRAMVEDHPAPPSSITLAAIDNTIIPGDHPVPARWYRPTLDPDQPAIVFIHGGGFIQRGLDSHDEMCRRLATGTGAAVVALDCRPAPEHPYPAAVDDTYAAIEHLTNRADALGIDASRIALAGISSGAAIAAGTALRCRDTGGPRAALQVLLTPMLRHRETTPARHTYGHGDHGITTALLDWYSDQYAPGTASDDPYCAPLRATDMRNLPPAYIHTAGLDPLQDDGIDYAQRLHHAGITVEHHHAAGLFHGFHFFTAALPQADDQAAAEIEAIRRLLAGPTASPRSRHPGVTSGDALPRFGGGHVAGILGVAHVELDAIHHLAQPVCTGPAQIDHPLAKARPRRPLLPRLLPLDRYAERDDALTGVHRSAPCDFRRDFSHRDRFSATFLALCGGSGRLSCMDLASTPPHAGFVAATKSEYSRLSRLAKAGKRSGSLLDCTPSERPSRPSK